MKNRKIKNVLDYFACLRGKQTILATVDLMNGDGSSKPFDNEMRQMLSHLKRLLKKNPIKIKAT